MSLAGADGRRGGRGEGDGPVPGSRWTGVSIGQWDAERLDWEARSILNTSGLVLTVMTIGLIGFAELFGADTESLAALDRLFLGNLALLLLFGAVGLSGVVVSVLCATLALRGIGAGSVADYRGFDAPGGEPGEPDGAAPGRCGKAAGGQHAPRSAYARRLDALSKSNRRAARYIRLGRVYMSYGLASIFAISMVIITGMIYTLMWAEISAAADAAQMCLDTGRRDWEPTMLAKLWAEANPPLTEWPGAHGDPSAGG